MFYILESFCRPAFDLGGCQIFTVEQDQGVFCYYFSVSVAVSVHGFHSCFSAIGRDRVKLCHAFGKNVLSGNAG